MKTYLILLGIFLASLVAAIFLPVAESVKTLSAIPALLALFGALSQLIRDRIAHEQSLLMQELQNSFSIGAASHMANVAFDKHVSFSEEYVSKMFDILAELFREGPRKTAVDRAGELVEIRKKWSLWITSQVETDLEKFERTVRSIGAHALVVEADSAGADRMRSVKLMYKQFAEVMGSKVMGSTQWEGEDISEEVALHRIIGILRKVLGVEELTRLRTQLVSQAINRQTITSR